MYSVVLGLEVLGNPVGFVRGLKTGTVGLFYYPIQVDSDLGIIDFSYLQAVCTKMICAYIQYAWLYFYHDVLACFVMICLF